ncbi:WASP homolog-associated protein with actin, membranes and microtubules [Scyliorhinus canicula]|uniref:WASP homolog-associated protein with actin, membranes and microtubules n=1 Tax=Scyliorhinus canicula TaxID=7830 RepID=UPI0018F67F90|nr:WASP homolog-associated protein with actin, membranes and microtubules [Scyliorhinus canicula]
MESEQPDSLEGWVAVRADVFAERGRLRFLVGWNEVEEKFALTCHSGGRQRGGRAEPQAPGGRAEPQAPGGRAEPQAPGSWAALYRPEELRAIHRQLAASCSALEACLPALPELRAAGLWGLLFPGSPQGPEPDPGLQPVCRQLEQYLGAAAELCGRRILLDSVFPAAADGEYFENLTEFRRKSLEHRVALGREALREILHQHRTAKDMVTLKAIYQEEDEAYQELVTAATQFYQYLLQPFRHMRECASFCKQEVLKSLEFDELGPRRIQSLQKDAEEWSRRMQEAVCSIQDITVDYFKETVKALAAMQKQMEEDQNHFGKAAWSSVAPRLEKLKFMFAKETLQHTRAKELCLNRRKAGIQHKMEHLDTEEAVEMVDELEIQYYETQLELYNIQLEMLKYEELLLFAQLDTIRRQIKEKEEEVIYYDTCEDPQQLQTTDEQGLIHDTRSVDMKKLWRKAQQLETKRGRIGARRSYLRNKRDQCEESQKAKQEQERENQERQQHHHSIQAKRDQKKEENKRRREWVNQEREKTLQRLRTFKEKSSAHFVFQPCFQTLEAQRQFTPLPPSSSISEQPKSLMDHSPRKKQTRTRTSKAEKGRPPAPNDIPVQTLLPAGAVPPGQAETHGISPVPSTIPPPPQLPPPPPPPPLPLMTASPSTLLGNKSTSVDNDQVQPLIFSTENSAKKSLKENIGTMDDVLASLKRGEILLKKVDRAKPQSVGRLDDPRENMLATIRKGIQLRKVTVGPNVPAHSDPVNDLERSIKAAMKRMKKVSPDSDEEADDGSQSEEWES